MVIHMSIHDHLSARSRSNGARLLGRAIACSLAIAALCANASADGHTATKDLAPTDWAGIRAAYDAGRHTAVATSDGYAARNPGQGWSTTFDSRGFTTTTGGDTWTWGLELTGWGRGDVKTTAALTPSLKADGARVERTWNADLTEWYVNDGRGLEHGYTLRTRPAGNGPLQLTLAVRGGLIPRVSTDGRDVAFTDRSGAAAVTYNALTVFDAAGTTIPARFQTVADGLRLTVDDRDARYPLTIDPIAQQAYLKASNTGANDSFGVSLAISGDTVVVGAGEEDSAATGANGNQSNNSVGDSGAAYIFVRSGTTWSQQAYLKASNTGINDSFGNSVAISGDTVVIGAANEDSDAVGVDGNQSSNTTADAGAAYVFVRSGGVWTQQAYLKASNTGAGDQFGWTVGISGDTLVVGALAEDSNAVGVNGDQGNNSAASSGAAYVFVRNGTTWTQQAYLKASNTEAGDGFGTSVAISGDTIVAGATSEDSNAVGVNGDQSNNTAFSSGAAYVFVRSGTAWSQQAYLKPSGTEASQLLNHDFGVSVAVSGETIVVGADLEYSTGGAHVFSRLGTTWNHEAHLVASNADEADRFGQCVAISGDTIVVGARSEDSGGTGVNNTSIGNDTSGSGAAYVFVRNGPGWSQHAFLKASNARASAAFGCSVSVSGDTVVVGSYNESSNAAGINGNQANTGAVGAGAAYVFLVPPTVEPCAGMQPAIAQHPSGQSVAVGTTASFTVSATSPNASGLTYQWRRNGVNLTSGGTVNGTNTPTLTINPVAPIDNAAAFDCVVTNTCGTTTSYPAGLAATAAPRCLADLGSQGGIPGPDSFLDNNDFIIFIDYYFNQTGCP